MSVYQKSFSPNDAKEVSDFICRIFITTDAQADISELKEEFLRLYSPEHIQEKWVNDLVSLFRNEMGELVGVGRAKENGWITHCYVEPNLHGQGIGKNIMEVLLNWCKDKGIHEVSLNSEEGNLGFYQKLGFLVQKEKLEHGAKAFLLKKMI